MLQLAASPLVGAGEHSGARAEFRKGDVVNLSMRELWVGVVILGAAHSVGAGDARSAWEFRGSLGTFVVASIAAGAFGLQVSFLWIASRVAVSQAVCGGVAAAFVWAVAAEAHIALGTPTSNPAFAITGAIFVTAALLRHRHAIAPTSALVAAFNCGIALAFWIFVLQASCLQPLGYQ